MEGVTRKQHRSLRSTLSRGLRQAPQTTLAWIAVLTLTFGPIGLVGVLLMALNFVSSELVTSLPVLLFASLSCLGWLIWAVAHYTLLPYVKLFEPASDWRYSLARSQQLVERKGQLFLVSTYIAMLLSLAACYGVSLLIQSLTHLNSALIFLLFGAVVLTSANASLTLFYRKRKLAKK
jgi:hypothetical protein